VDNFDKEFEIENKNVTFQSYKHSIDVMIDVIQKYKPEINNEKYRLKFIYWSCLTEGLLSVDLEEKDFELDVDSFLKKFDSEESTILSNYLIALKEDTKSSIIETLCNWNTKILSLENTNPLDAIRKCPCYTLNHEYPTPDKLPDLLSKFENIYTIKEKNIQEINSREINVIETIKFAAWAYYYVLSIHPFVDGNGRTARLLANHIIKSISKFDVPQINGLSICPSLDYLIILIPRNSYCLGLIARLFLESLFFTYSQEQKKNFFLR
jgi:hypothetical protein